MSFIVMKAVELTGFSNSDEDVNGKYLETYDPEAHEGRGFAQFTSDLAKAMKFDTHAQAFDLWKSTPRSRPTRPDGKPNRPLTAFTINFEEVHDQ